MFKKYALKFLIIASVIFLASGYFAPKVTLADGQSVSNKLSEEDIHTFHRLIGNLGSPEWKIRNDAQLRLEKVLSSCHNKGKEGLYNALLRKALEGSKDLEAITRIKSLLRRKEMLNRDLAALLNSYSSDRYSNIKKRFGPKKAGRAIQKDIDQFKKQIKRFLGRGARLKGDSLAKLIHMGVIWTPDPDPKKRVDLKFAKLVIAATDQIDKPYYGMFPVGGMGYTRRLIGTPLKLSIQLRHPGLVRLLLQRGADPTIVLPPSQEPMLSKGIKKRNEKIREILKKAIKKWKKKKQGK